MNNIKTILLVASITISCGKPSDTSTSPSPENQESAESRIVFSDLETQKAGGSAPLKFKATIQSHNPIREVSLWARHTSGWEEIERIILDTLGDELIKNGGMDDFQTGIAKYFHVKSHEDSDVELTKDYGSQKIEIFNPGQYVFFHQEIKLLAKRQYRVGFWYKTSDTQNFYCNIGIRSLNIPGTNNKWRYKLFTFRSNLEKSVIGFLFKNAHTVSIDDFSVKEVIKESQRKVASLEISTNIALNKYDVWFIEVIDNLGSQRSKMYNVVPKDHNNGY